MGSTRGYHTTRRREPNRVTKLMLFSPIVPEQGGLRLGLAEPLLQWCSQRDIDMGMPSAPPPMPYTFSMEHSLSLIETLQTYARLADRCFFFVTRQLTEYLLQFPTCLEQLPK